MNKQKYKSLLDIYWKEVILNSKWIPERQVELNRQLGDLVKTDQDKREAWTMQNELYQKLVNS